MPPTVDDRLRDMLEAILKIEKLTHGADLAGLPLLKAFVNGKLSEPRS